MDSKLCRLLFVFGSLILMGRPAAAGDVNGSYTVIGQGFNSCGKYTEARKEPKSADAAIYSIWLAGYLTRTNLQLPDTHDIIGNTDLDGALGWIDNYCSANPTSNVARAAEDLVVFLMPKRTRKAAQ